MRVVLVAIGNELLNGRILDYNSHWITKRFTSLGITVKRIFVIPDIEDDILDVLRWANENKIDLVVTTGGLGPTPGDITLDCVAKFLGRRLVVDERAKEMVARRYRELYNLGFVKSPDLNEARLKMAKIPEKCEPIHNDVGVAPGVLCREGEMQILSLPGVPSEMMYLLEKALPLILRERVSKPLTYEFRVECGDESIMSKILSEAMKRFENISVKTYPEGFGDKVFMKIIVELKKPLKEEEKVKELFNDVKKFIENEVKEIEC